MGNCGHYWGVGRGRAGRQETGIFRDRCRQQIRLQCGARFSGLSATFAKCEPARPRAALSRTEGPPAPEKHARRQPAGLSHAARDAPASHPATASPHRFVTPLQLRRTQRHPVPRRRPAPAVPVARMMSACHSHRPKPRRGLCSPEALLTVLRCEVGLGAKAPCGPMGLVVRSQRVVSMVRSEPANRWLAD